MNFFTHYKSRRMAISFMSMVAVLGLSSVFPLMATADENSTVTTYKPTDVRHPKSPVENEQFAFVIGDWDIDMMWFPKQGDPVPVKGNWHNHWINNGFDVMQEWTGARFFGSEFRHYDVKLGHWVGMNLYAGNTWVHTTANMDGNNMVVIIQGSNPREGAFLNKETYFDIEENTWKMKSERSFDQGKTWEKGKYEMVATRIK